MFSDQTREQETYRKQIIRWFGDYLCDESPFSMHRLVEVGKTLGKQPGEWFGPASVAHILKYGKNFKINAGIIYICTLELCFLTDYPIHNFFFLFLNRETMIRGQKTQTVLNDLCVYVSQDCTGDCLYFL